MKKPIICSLLLLLIGVNSFSQVRIACSSNMFLALEEWVNENSLRDQVHLIPGATMNLFHQIQNGAPFHIFICADPEISKKMDSRRDGPNTSFVVNRGYLVLWSKDNISVEKFYGYGSGDTRIGLSDPNTTPFGRLALMEIEDLKIDGTRVYADGVIQVNQYIKSRGVDLAMTSNSILRFRADLGGYFIEFQERSVENKAHLLVEDPESRKVFQLLESEESQAIWREFFFLTN